MKFTIFLLFILCATTVLALDYWDSGTVFITGDGDEFTVNPTLTSDLITINYTCINVTGGNRSGIYCDAESNITVSSCLDTYEVIPYYNDSRYWGSYASNPFLMIAITSLVPKEYYDYILPVGENDTMCAFNITNNGEATINFDMLFNGSMSYTEPDLVIESFDYVFGREETLETVWVNSTYNWTRTCFTAQKYLINYTQPPSSMKILYNFNNSDDTAMDKWNGTHWIGINTTWGCQQWNYVQMNLTKEIYQERAVWDNITLDYALIKGSPVNMTLNVTTGHEDNLTYFTKTVRVDNASWNTLTMSVNGIYREVGGNGTRIPRFRIELNGSQDGVIVIDKLSLNTSDTDSSGVDLLVGDGNVSFGECWLRNLYTSCPGYYPGYPGTMPKPNATGITKLNSSYQTIFSIPVNETKQLSFWFNFTRIKDLGSHPMVSGLSIPLSDLWYSTSGGGII